MIFILCDYFDFWYCGIFVLVIFAFCYWLYLLQFLYLLCLPVRTYAIFCFICCLIQLQHLCYFAFCNICNVCFFVFVFWYICNICFFFFALIDLQYLLCLSFFYIFAIFAMDRSIRFRLALDNSKNAKETDDCMKTCSGFDSVFQFVRRDIF